LKTLLAIFFVFSSLTSFGQKNDSSTKNTQVDILDNLINAPIVSDSLFIITGKAIDTLYYKNRKIESIKYQGGDEIGFFESGQTKYQSVNGSYRSWYKNGTLRSESILRFNHYRTETEWYSNGRIKEKGTMHWGHNDQTNSGDWLKNDDWRYWKRNGEEKK
jgi:antitoxin component YwqK of YwqJK toxin-antitoxin module